MVKSLPVLKPTPAPSGPWRWWSEFRRPALKCERVGHVPNGEWRRGYQRADYFKDFRAVVVKVRQERHVCFRCKVKLSPWVETKRSCINSYGAPQNVWDQIEDGDGYWFERGGFAVATGAAEPSPRQVPNDGPGTDQIKGEKP